MAEAHKPSGDGLPWRFRLREGLAFHDGAPVRGADRVAGHCHGNGAGCERAA